MLIWKKKKYKPGFVPNRMKAFLIREAASYASYFQEISGLWMQKREYQHEVKQRHLLMMSYLEREEYENAKKLCRDGIREAEDIESVAKTGNPGFDRMIGYKAAVAEKNGTALKVNAAIPSDIKMSNMDLYAMLGNLLDNAIEATKRVSPEEREIYLKAEIKEENLYLEIGNFYDGEVKKDKGEYLTTKSYEKGCGAGIRIVEEIVGRYQGKITITDENHYFCVKILLRSTGR